MTTTPPCEGCEKPLDLMSLAGGYKVCFDCIKARAKTGFSGRCVCGAKKRPGPEQGTQRRYGRRWIPCQRCLGTIRQTN